MTFPVLSMLPSIQGVTFSRQLPCEVFRSGNGTETRQSLIDNTQGRRAMSIQLKGLKSFDAQRILAVLEASQERLIWAPFSPLTIATTGATSGASVPIPFLPYGYANGGKAFLMTIDGRTASVHNITGVSSSAITLDPAPGAGVYPAGSLISPALLCYGEDFSREHKLDNCPRGTAALVELDPAVAPGGGLPQTYLGLWVFGEGSDYTNFLPRRSVVSQAMSQAATLGLAFQPRTRTIEVPIQFDVTLQLLLRQPLETGLAWNIQEALKGQLGRLWVRSYIEDFRAIEIDGAVVQIEDKGQGRLYDRARHVWDRTNRTGHKVTDVNEVGGFLELTLDPAPSASASVFEMLFLSRFLGDTLEMSPASVIPRHWDCTMQFKELVREYADVEAE